VVVPVTAPVRLLQDDCPEASVPAGITAVTIGHVLTPSASIRTRTAKMRDGMRYRDQAVIFAPPS